MDLGLKGKKVIMNGGAHGLGLQALKLFAAEGADVAFFSRKEDKIAAAVAEIDAAGPGKVFAEVFDMATGTDAYQAWLEKAAQELGGCDIFVHTASASGTGGAGDWQACLDMDIKGAAYAVETLTPYLEASGSGSIVMLSIDRRARNLHRAQPVQRAEGRADHLCLAASARPMRPRASA